MQDRGITRDLHWGIPVMDGDKPWPGMEGKVFYVWFDAPIEYIAGTAEWADANGLPDAAWQRWWRTDMGAKDVTYYQFMGKDNVPFHTLSFPATIIGSGQPWKLVDYLKSFNYLNYDGGQFSTSRGRGVFMDQALSILPVGLLALVAAVSHAPESADSEFTWENFQTSVNKDLADVLGNLVCRVTKFCIAKFGADRACRRQLRPTGNRADRRPWRAHHRIRRPDGGDGGAQGRSRIARHLGDRQRIPASRRALDRWSKTDPEQAQAMIRLALNLIRVYAILSRPFIPDAAASMMAAMGSDDWTWPDDISEAMRALPAGQAFSVPENLFRKITDEERADWQNRFAGVRD